MKQRYNDLRLITTYDVLKLTFEGDAMPKNERLITTYDVLKCDIW